MYTLMLLEDINVSSSLYYSKTLMSPTLNMIINYQRSAYEGYPSIFNFKAKAVSLCSQGYRCNLSEIVHMRCKFCKIAQIWKLSAQSTKLGWTLLILKFNFQIKNPFIRFICITK